MTRRRFPPAELREQVNRLMVHRNGHKALKTVDLARFLGAVPERLYQLLRVNLWLLAGTFTFQLTQERRRGSPLFEPALAFTKSGVMAIAGLLNDDPGFEVSVDIARILQQRRRSKRAPRRSEDLVKAASYHRACAAMVTCSRVQTFERVVASDRALGSERKKAYARLHAQWKKLEKTLKRNLAKKRSEK